MLQGRGGIQVGDPGAAPAASRDELLSRPDQLAELGALARSSVGGDPRRERAQRRAHALACCRAEGPPRERGRRSILVVRYSALGDVVLATSVLEPLRAALPRRAHRVGHRAAVRAAARGAAASSPRVHRARARRDPDGALALARAAARPVRPRDRPAEQGCAAGSSRGRRRRAGSTFRRRTASAGGRRRCSGSDPPLVARRTRPRSTPRRSRRSGSARPGPTQVNLSPQARALAADALQRRRRARRGARAGRALGDEALAAGAVRRGRRRARRATAAGSCSAAAPATARPSPRSAPRCGRRSPPTSPPCRSTRSPRRSPRVQLLVACDSGPVHLATAVGTPGPRALRPDLHVRWGPPSPGRALSLGLAVLAVLEPRRRLVPGGPPPLPRRPRPGGRGARGRARDARAR